MTNFATQKPLKVRNEGNYGPFMKAPFAQLKELRSLFDRHGITYEVDDIIISLEGGPEMVNIDFDREADPATIQAVLDSAP